jgi:hypothetical protein
MRKWRPAYKCLYIIPEVHGNARSLEIILSRILPFRIFKNQKDSLVMLGDYIDGSDESANVIEILINIKKEYGERVILLKGNHEQMLLSAINGNDNDFKYWVDSGGINTISSYLTKYNIKLSPYSVNRTKLLDIIPKTHIEFIASLDAHHIIDEYIFFHGGFDINKSIIENTPINFMFDTISSKIVKSMAKNNLQPEYKDDYIKIGSHNFNGKRPFISQKYMMLGGTLPQKMIILELNSMECSAITNGKDRIYKYKLF